MPKKLLYLHQAGKEIGRLQRVPDTLRTAWVLIVSEDEQFLRLIRDCVAQRSDGPNIVMIAHGIAQAKKAFALHTWDIVIESGVGKVDEPASEMAAFLAKNGFHGHLWRVPLNEQADALRARFDQVSKDCELPVVAVIEDDPFLVMAWASVLEGSAEFHLFRDPGEFASILQSNPTWRSEISWCITDYQFPDYQGRCTPEDIAQLMHDAGRPVFLSSNGDFSDDILALFTAKIGKEPLTIEQLGTLYPI